jgi:hypothetical protein
VTAAAYPRPRDAGSVHTPHSAVRSVSGRAVWQIDTARPSSIPIAQGPEVLGRAGVRTTIAGYSYIHGNDASPPPAEHQARVPLPTEQFLEVVSSANPLTREELRAICDQHKTPDAIRQAIERR